MRQDLKAGSRFEPFFKYGKAPDEMTHHFRSIGSLDAMRKTLFHVSEKQMAAGTQQGILDISAQAPSSQLHPLCGHTSVISWWRNRCLLLNYIYIFKACTASVASHGTASAIYFLLI